VPHTVSTDDCYGSERNVNIPKNEYNIRRGFEEVHAEQMDKVIAHNFIHMIRKEEAAKKLLKVS